MTNPTPAAPLPDLVEAAARELLRLNQNYIFGDPTATTVDTFMGAARSLLAAVGPLIRAAERERCVEAVEAERQLGDTYEGYYSGYGSAIDNSIEAIRALGDA